MQQSNKRKQPASSQKKQAGPKRRRGNDGAYYAQNPGRQLSQDVREQIGAVVQTRLTRLGVSDIRDLRIAWVAGFTFVGNGTNGTANSVYFETASSTYLIKGNNPATPSSGLVPISAADTDLGQAYVRDIIKHFARLVIKKLLIHVDSLQPSTSNNMMAVVAPWRGPGGGEYSNPSALATASVAANTVGNVSSMKGAVTVDSWESKCIDITDAIAGGSGAKQNEFEIQAEGPTTSLYAGGNSPAANDFELEGLIPACFAVAGNNTTTGLQNTQVHQISIEMIVDLLDYVGGMTQVVPLG